MEGNERQALDSRIRNFFVQEIRKSCGKDFELIEDKIDELITVNNLRQTILAAKLRIAVLKNNMQQESQRLV
jgi:hypothetical protein